MINYGTVWQKAKGRPLFLLFFSWLVGTNLGAIIFPFVKNGAPPLHHHEALRTCVPSADYVLLNRAKWTWPNFDRFPFSNWGALFDGWNLDQIIDVPPTGPAMPLLLAALVLFSRGMIRSVPQMAGLVAVWPMLFFTVTSMAMKSIYPHECTSWNHILIPSYMAAALAFALVAGRPWEGMSRHGQATPGLVISSLLIGMAIMAIALLLHKPEISTIMGPDRWMFPSPLSTKAIWMAGLGASSIFIGFLAAGSRGACFTFLAFSFFALLGTVIHLLPQLHTDADPRNFAAILSPLAVAIGCILAKRNVSAIGTEIPLGRGPRL